MNSVGYRLRKARVDAGYETAADAARAFGWHPQNVRDHEADRRGVSPEQAAIYANCVVGLKDGRILLKQLQRAGDQFVLVSTIEPPMIGCEVAWAAKVTNIRPR